MSVKHEVFSTPAKRNKTECSSDDSIIENSPDSSLISMNALSKKIFLKPVLDKPAADEILPHNTLKSLLTNDNDDVLLRKVAESVPISHNIKCVSLSDLTEDTCLNLRNMRRHLSSESIPFAVSSGLIMHYNEKPDTQDNTDVIDCIGISAIRPTDDTLSNIRSISLSDLTTDINTECRRRCMSSPAMKTLFCQSTNVGSINLESEDLINFDNECQQPLDLEITNKNSPENDQLTVKQAINQDEISSDRLFVDNSLSSLLTDEDLIKKASESVPLSDYALTKERSLSLSNLTSGDIKKCHRRRCKSTSAIETFSVMPCFDLALIENNDLIENDDDDDEYFPPDMVNDLSDSSTAIGFSDEEHSHGNLNNRKRKKKIYAFKMEEK